MAFKARPFSSFRWLYLPLAISAASIPFLHLFENIYVRVSPITSFSATYGTLFELAGNLNGGPAVLALLLLAAFIAASVWAMARPAVMAAPAIAALLAGLLILMLLTKPGMGEPTPQLTPAGNSALWLGVTAAVTAIGHIVSLLLTGKPEYASQSETD